VAQSTSHPPQEQKTRVRIPPGYKVSKDVILVSIDCFFSFLKIVRDGERTRDLLTSFIFSFHHFTAEPQRLPLMCTVFVLRALALKYMKNVLTEQWQQAMANNPNNYCFFTFYWYNMLQHWAKYSSEPWRRGIVVIASASRTEDPGFESCQGVRFLGLDTLQCFC
jgi:hypothetical protein